MKYLLDTCVISELVAKKPDPKVVDWIDSVDSDSAYLSVITRNEIDFKLAGVSIINPWG